MTARAINPAGEPTDSVVVGTVLAGDTDAFATLVRRHQELLYRHARGMGLDRDTSLDLVQDAFVRAHARLASCRQPEHFRAWVFQICRNLCLDHLKAAPRRDVSLDALPDAFAVAGGDPDLRLTLRTALARLSVPLREAFLLRHLAGHSYEEIAALVAATPSAAKMRVHRARETLHAFLTAEGVTPGSTR
ncbi:MAG: sigma-70 family RNA polymerase sigma factor [Gemmatimonadales bacterium]|nr:sigma-70 family RNA polymerase sigma factor [Gemmatimonadales bacterium]